jgi:hypothetical protein
MSAARSRRNTDATYVVGGARWLVAKLIRFDHRSIRRPRPMVEALIEWSTAWLEVASVGYLLGRA